MSKTTKPAASSRPPASECVGRVDDLILQILILLPVKSLIRLKVVSKQWLSLISDPKFVESHVPRNPRSSPSGMFVDYPLAREIDYFWLGECGGVRTNDNELARPRPSIGFLDNPMILQACNGLFLCYSRNTTYSNLCVCNPTRQYRLLPPVDGNGIEGEWAISGLGFAFDPSVSPHYKAACEKYQQGSDNTSWIIRVEVYSSEDHQWRLVDEFKNSEKPTEYYVHGVFSNGGIHWLGHNSSHLDVKSESLVRIPMPPLPNIGGSVAGVKDMFLYSLSRSSNLLYVFDISNDYRKWVYKCNITVGRLRSAYPEIDTTKRFNRQVLCKNYLTK